MPSLTQSSTGVKRVKTGCITCRIRSVKCDETKPLCHRCVTTGRKCDGYSSLAFSRRELVQANASRSGKPSLHRAASSADYSILAQLVSDPGFSDTLEKRYFQFFRQRTVQGVTSRFWDRVVLQFLHAEPAVKHAVLALSALHQLMEIPDHDPMKAEHLAFAEKQHRKALTAAKLLVASATKDDVDRVLTACVIFISYEGIRGDYTASRVHLESGRSILWDNRERLRHSSRRNDLMEIQYALARRDFVARTFQDGSVGPLARGIDDCHGVHLLTAVPEHGFDGFAEAHASFTDLVRFTLMVDLPDTYSAASEGTWDMAVYRAELARCKVQMQHWRQRFEELLIRKPDIAPPLAIALLRLLHTSGTAIAAAGFFGPETRWDGVLQNFVDAVALAEDIVAGLCLTVGQSSFSVEMGCESPPPDPPYLVSCADCGLTASDIDSTFLVATRCRDPAVRRRAIKVLRKLPRQEGIWQSTGAAAVAQRWLEVEEDGLVAVHSVTDIPEYRRVAEIRTSIDADASSGHLELVLSNAECPDVEPVVRHEFVQWQRQKA
ncbi:hypothetical protein LTR53_001606 [Teratosphaeriaceae sp. CCFEE 6253]|nr:hypothetical protein LTR53_001606 [Teratosphaeriaceae sp. CCFEE 6253]